MYLTAEAELLPIVVHGNFGAYSFEEPYKYVFIVNLRWQYMMQETSCRINIESDEEMDGGFSCLLEEKETGG